MPTNFPASFDDFENPTSNVIIASQAVSGPNELIENAFVNPAQVFVRFKTNIKVSTILNVNIILETNSATPIIVSSDAFEEIQTNHDYNSISKTLRLTWKPGILQPTTDYKLRFKNFRTVTNVVLADDFVEFETSLEVVPDPEDLPAVPPPVEIIDYSIVPDIITAAYELDDDDAGNNIIFKLIDSDPINFDAFLPEDYNNGVVILKFSLSPKIDFLTSNYILVQKKLIQRLQSRWVTVPVQISLDPDNPWVYLAFPSTDATPVYNTSGVIYFEKNVKYRIRLSADIGV